MNNSNWLKHLLLFCWGTLFLLIVVTIYYCEHDKKAIKTSSIGHVKSLKGLVKYRAEDYVIWKNVDKNHDFSVGDRVATGPKSTIKIVVEGNRIIELGENSQVKLTAVESTKTFSYFISLFKGSLSARSLETTVAERPFTIVAGKSEYSLSEKDDEIGVYKSLDNDEGQVFTLKQRGETIINTPKPGELSDL